MFKKLVLSANSLIPIQKFQIKPFCLRTLQFSKKKSLFAHKNLDFLSFFQGAAGSVTLKELLTDPVYWKPLSVVILLMLFQQFAGINAVIFYTARIFSQAGSDLDDGRQSIRIFLRMKNIFIFLRFECIHRQRGTGSTKSICQKQFKNN